MFHQPETKDPLFRERIPFNRPPNSIVFGWSSSPINLRWSRSQTSRAFRRGTQKWTYPDPETKMTMENHPFLIGDTSSNCCFSIVMSVLWGGVIKIHQNLNRQKQCRYDGPIENIQILFHHNLEGIPRNRWNCHCFEYPTRFCTRIHTPTNKTDPYGTLKPLPLQARSQKVAWKNLWIYPPWNWHIPWK